MDDMVYVELCQFSLVNITYLVQFTDKITYIYLSVTFFSVQLFSECLQHLLKVKHLTLRAYKAKQRAPTKL